MSITSKQDAEHQIAAILRDLEQLTESVVSDVCIQGWDTTTFSDVERRSKRAVYVEMEPRPGHDWVVGGAE